MFQDALLKGIFLDSPLFTWLNANNVLLLGPELIIALGLIFIVIQSLFVPTLSKLTKKPDTTITWRLALMCVLFAFVALLLQFYMQYRTSFFSTSGLAVWTRYDVLSGVFQADLFSWLMRLLLVFGSVLLLLFTGQYVNTHSGQKTKEYYSAEFYILLLGALVGALVMVGAADLMLLFVGLETLGISSYIMAGYLRQQPRSTEAAFKYLVFGGASTAILLFGFSLIYGLTGGQTQYTAIAQVLSPLLSSSVQQTLPVVQGLTSSKPILLPVAITMIIGAFAFKLSAAPFHMWTPDVYDGAPTPVTAFLSVISKLAAFSMLIRFFVTFNLHNEGLVFAFTALSITSMLVGNVLALKQTNVKRMLAYSTIAHAGYLLLGMVAFAGTGVVTQLSNMVFYLVSYLFMNLGAFAVVVLLGLQLGSDQLSAYAGLFKKRPVLAFALSIFLLSLAGIPITAGFFAKFFLFQSLASLGVAQLWTVGIALIASVVSLYYYVNVIRLMVVAEPSEQVNHLKAYGHGLMLPKLVYTPAFLSVGICLLGTVLLGLWSDPCVRFINTALKPIGVNPMAMMGMPCPFAPFGSEMGRTGRPPLPLPMPSGGVQNVHLPTPLPNPPTAY
jgi:NAD(P)H-quinone oxidoreductase subunit 2